MSYIVTSEQFEGPLAVLLELIESAKLDISEIGLSNITEKFLAHLEEVERVSPMELADFLVVAAKLLYLKSRSLLPDLEEEESEEPSLADQLRMYQRFAEAAVRLSDVLSEHHESYQLPRRVDESVSFAPPDILPSDLKEALEDVIARAVPYVSLPEALMERTVSVEEKIADLVLRIERDSKTLFSSLTTRGSKADIVVNFLALLELLKQQKVRVKQADAFHDIEIEST